MATLSWHDNTLSDNRREKLILIISTVYRIMLKSSRSILALLNLQILILRPNLQYTIPQEI